MLTKEQEERLKKAMDKYMKDSENPRRVEIRRDDYEPLFDHQVERDKLYEWNEKIEKKGKR